MVKRRELENIASHQLKHAKREYDSDEEEEAKASGGTWEHKLRKAEMEATRGKFKAFYSIVNRKSSSFSIVVLNWFLDWAIKLTDMAEHKHHIGDFLPPHELKKFMETYKVILIKDFENPK